MDKLCDAIAECIADLIIGATPFVILYLIFQAVCR